MGHNCLADQWGRRQEVEGAWGWREGDGGGLEAVGGRQREGFYSKILLRLVVVQSIKLITISMKLLGTILN